MRPVDVPGELASTCCAMRKTKAAVTVLFVFLAVPWALADFDEGVPAYNCGGYATALREFRVLAAQGGPGGVGSRHWLQANQ